MTDDIRGEESTESPKQLDPDVRVSHVFVATTLPSAGILRRPTRLSLPRRFLLRVQKMVALRLTQLADWIDPPS